MRYVIIPETITLRSLLDASGKHPEQDFVGFVQHVLANNPETVAKDADLVLFFGAAKRFRDKKVGETVALTDAEHELLCRLARTYNYEMHVKLDMFQYVVHLIEAPSEELAPIKGEPKAEHRVRPKR